MSNSRLALCNSGKITEQERRLIHMTIKEQCASLVDELRTSRPLVHCVTNYVTAGDCANMLLAAGASPIMADEPEECAEITARAGGLVLNIGTLKAASISAMERSARTAAELSIPMVFDPVGAGASNLRTKTADSILHVGRAAAIRGNLSEIAALAGLSFQSGGVDVSEADQGRDPLEIALCAAHKHRCAVAVTGKVDLLTDGNRVLRIHNGHPMLKDVTGTGCMASALAGGYCAVAEDPLVGLCCAVALMGIAGEVAFAAAGLRGTGSFRAALFDAVSQMDGKTFLERAKIDETDA